MKPAIWTLVALATVGLFIAQQRKLVKAQAESAALVMGVAEARQEAARAVEAAKKDPAEAQRIQDERAELVKLRAEVSALRKEKAAWEKKSRADAESAADLKRKASVQTAQAMQWVETVMNAPSPTKGAESGNLRRKLLNHEPLNDAEQSLLLNMMNKTGEIEKSPEEFAAFQTAFISSLLGWNEDPRAQKVQTTLTAASKYATERGLDFHAPAENADKWDDAQKTLNSRATGAVQKLLTPDERATFDKALLGVMGIDFGVGQKQ